MASWVTHLIIADEILKRRPELDRRSFCVGNIAPDCNVENEDWSAFTPSREVTHWMQGEWKTEEDCDAFCEAMILRRRAQISSREEYAFLLGYYAHLITDAAFHEMIHREDRVRTAWRRILADKRFRKTVGDMEMSWESIKALIPKRERMAQIHRIEAEYLRDHPDSGYLTEILPLKEFPDYLDYLPPGAIVRKIGVMGYRPRMDIPTKPFLAISREEYAAYLADTAQRVEERFRAKGL